MSAEIPRATAIDTTYRPTTNTAERRALQLARQHDALLVAAGQRPERGVERRRHDVEFAHEVSRPVPDAAPLEHSVAAHQLEVRHHEVLGDRHVDDAARDVAVLG